MKTASKAAVNSGDVRPIKAFNPVSGLPMKYDGAPTFYALITSSQDMYSMVMTKSYKVGNPLRQKIDTIVTATPGTQPAFC